MKLTSEMRKIQIKCMKIRSHLPAQRLILIQTMHTVHLYAFSTHSSSGYRKTLIQCSNFRTFLIYFVLGIENPIPCKIRYSQVYFCFIWLVLYSFWWFNFIQFFFVKLASIYHLYICRNSMQNNSKGIFPMLASLHTVPSRAEST